MAKRSIGPEEGRLPGSGEVYLCGVGRWILLFPRRYITIPILLVTPQDLTRYLAISAGRTC